MENGIRLLVRHAHALYPHFRRKVMKAVLAFSRESSLGFKAKRLRTSQSLTQQELAQMAGVSRQDIDSFERSMPLALDTRRKILKELWAKKQPGSDKH